MVNSFPTGLLAGTILGFLSGLGVGGGSLLILWLTLVLEMPQESARIINLMFFLPSALISSLFRRKQGSLPLGKALPAALAGCVGALLFHSLSGRIDIQLLKKLFGGLLILTGIRELMYKPRKT